MSTNLQNVNLVISRARELQEAVASGKSDDDVHEAARELARVASREDDQPKVSRFEPDPNRKQTDQADEDALTSISLSMQTGSLLIAAGVAMPNESSTHKNGSEALDLALQRLEITRNALSEDVRSRARFEAEIASIPAVIQPTDAPAEFRNRSDATLNALIADAEQVIGSVFKALNALDSAVILRALQQFAEQSESLTSAGLLLKQGIAQIQRAYNSLISLLGKDVLNKIKQKVEEIWTEFKNGKYTESALDISFGIRGVKAKIGTLFSSAEGVSQPRIASIPPRLLIDACEAIAPLAPKFKKHMTLLSGMIGAITIVSGIVAFTPIGPQAAPFIAGSYLLILGAVLVIGREYAGADWSLHWVKGAGMIVDALLSSAPAMNPPPPQPPSPKEGPNTKA